MIDLNDVILALEYVNSGLDSYAYFNSDSKEIIYIGDYDIYEGDLEDENYIILPSKYDIDEYSMMVDFINTIDDVKLSNMLASAINGRKAFRRFKDTCIENDIIENWYKFKDEKYKSLAINWCKKNNIEFKER